MIDSSAIDAALVDYLREDATLAALLPDGWFMDEGAPKLTRFGIVSLVIAADVPMLEGKRAHEDCLYLVKAVVLNDTTSTARLAAARIDALLDPQPPAPRPALTIPGYGLMVCRRVERVRALEVDEDDNQIRWQHRGGRYQVMAAPRSS